MTTGRTLLRRFVSQEAGLEVVEYAILAGLIVGVAVLTIAAIGAWVKLQFDTARTALGV